MPNDPTKPDAPPPAAAPTAPVPPTPAFGTAPVAPAPPFQLAPPTGAPAPLAAPTPSFQMPMAPPYVAPVPAVPISPSATPMGMPTSAMMAPPAAVAVPAPTHRAAVLGVRNLYRFAEEPVAQKAQVTVLETPRMPPDLPAPTRMDPGYEQLKIALEAQMARNAVAPMMYAPPNATRWFRFSPLEMFMEHVLARKLWTLE